MKNKAVGSIVFAIGLLVSLTPRFILPVCEWSGKQSGMNCGYMGRTEIFLGAIIISVAVGTFFSRGTESLRWLMLVALVTAATVLAVPQVLGYCPSAQMPCHYGTVPMIRLLGVLLIITAIVGMLLSRQGLSETA